MLKNVVVLGASAGVGNAIAERFAGEGYRTYGFHRGNHKASSTSSVRFITKDVGADRACVANGCHAVQELCGSVDVVVHSLSGASLGSILKTDPERTFNHLAHSFLWWVQRLTYLNMLSPGAHLIALSNPCPDFYLRNTGVIGAAKAALETYVKTLAVELGPRGYFVNCVRFSTVMTPALKRVVGFEAEQHMQRLHRHIQPAGHMQEADDVAEFVVQLAQNRWMNGAIVDLTGGATLTLMDYAFYGARR